MHYYKFNIADYRKDTGHLSRLEHSIYRDLIDWYYLDEKPIPLETQWVTRRLRLDPDDVPFLMLVLGEFFEKTDEGYRHRRIEAEIDQFHSRASANRANGKKGGRPTTYSNQGDKVDRVNNPMGFDSVATNNPMVTLTNNHKPITNNQREKTVRATRLSPDWKISEEYISEAKRIKPNLTDHQIILISHIFRDHWLGKAGKDGTKSDWMATWRNWIRREKDFIPSYQQPSQHDQPIKKPKAMPIPGRANNG